MSWLRSATGVIAALTVAVHLLVILAFDLGEAFVTGGFIPARASGLVEVAGALPTFLTPLSAAFLHADFAHLLLNMLLLIFCGRILEAALGVGPLLILYTVAAYVAALGQWMWEPTTLGPMVGASGAVSGLIGAFALGFGRPKPLVEDPRLNRALNVAWLLAAWVVIQLMFDLLAANDGMSLATPAHIAGFVAGLAVGPFLKAKESAGRRGPGG